MRVLSVSVTRIRCDAGHKNHFNSKNNIKISALLDLASKNKAVNRTDVCHRRQTLLAPFLTLGTVWVLPPKADALEDGVAGAGVGTQNMHNDGLVPNIDYPSGTPPPQASGSQSVPSPDAPTAGASTPSGRGPVEVAPSNSTSKVPLSPGEISDEAAKRLLEAEEERRKARRRGKGRIRELEEIRGELAEKELVLLEKEQELLDKEQTLLVLREELEIERKLRALLTKEKEKAEEEAALAMGLCSGGSMLP